MKVLSVKEAAPQLGKLVTDALNGEAIFLTDGVSQVQLTPRVSDEPNIDFNSPELKEALLRSLEGPFRPYSHELTRKACRAAVAQKKSK